jgi:hypothetical protein
MCSYLRSKVSRTFSVAAFVFKICSRFGIFRLTDPPGLEAVMTCRAKETFHPHPDHLAIYTVRDILISMFHDLSYHSQDCDGSHVRLVSGMHLEIVDLRRGQDFSSSEGTRDV